jgi:Tubulin-tyrosine ligase family
MFEFILLVLIILIGVCADASREPSRRIGRGERPKKLTVVEDNAFFIDKYRSWMSGFRAVPTTVASADWVFSVGIGSRASEKIRARLRSRLDSTEISDKVRFHEHARKLTPHLIAETAEIIRGADGKIVPVTGQSLPNGPWMVRANWGWHGLASGVAINLEELGEWFDKLSIAPENSVSRSKVPPRVIASKYILKPMLHNGFKFHVRVHVIVVVLESRRYAVMPDRLELILAGKPYVAKNWTDADIHDTHDARNAEVVMLAKLPNSPTLRSNIAGAMRELFGQSATSMLPLLQIYPESKCVCELFGVDIMIREDQSIVVLEVNSRPGIDGDASHMLELRDELYFTFMKTAGVDVFGKGAFSAEFNAAPDQHVLL